MSSKLRPGFPAWALDPNSPQMKKSDEFIKQDLNGVGKHVGPVYTEPGLVSISGKVGDYGGTVGVDNGKPFGSVNKNGMDIGQLVAGLGNFLKTQISKGDPVMGAGLNPQSLPGFDQVQAFRANNDKIARDHWLASGGTPQGYEAQKQMQGIVAGTMGSDVSWAQPNNAAAFNSSVDAMTSKPVSGVNPLKTDAFGKMQPQVVSAPPPGYNPANFHNMREVASGWPPGVKEQFDGAVVMKDIPTIKALLPQVPAGYLKDFSQIAQLLKGG